MTLSRCLDWICEDDPVSHSPLSKDYASQRNLLDFLTKNEPNKNGLHKGSPKFREENCYSPNLMKTLGSILVNVYSKEGGKLILNP